MIWGLFALMALATALYLVPPRRDADPAAPAEATAYFAQIDALRADATLDPAERDAAVLTLERQLLRGDADAPSRATRSTLASSLIGGAAVIAVALVTYAATGTPTPPEISPQQQANLTPGNPDDLAALVAQLETRLTENDSRDPQGWLLLARSQMRLSRFAPALESYARALSFAESDAAAGIAAERDQAKAFAADRAPSALPRRGPSAQDVEAARAMTEADRQAMIEGMVEGLAARLAEAPDDPQGWARLLRARGVLGQAEQAERDLATVRALYADSPDVLAAILRAAGQAEGESAPDK